MMTETEFEVLSFVQIITSLCVTDWVPWSSVCRMFIRNIPWDKCLWKEAGVSRESSRLGCRPRSNLSPLGMLELEWPFRIVPGWPKVAWPLYSHISQARPVERRLFLVKGLLHSWGIPDFLHGRGSMQGNTVYAPTESYDDELFLWWCLSCFSRHRQC